MKCEVVLLLIKHILSNPKEHQLSDAVISTLKQLTIEDIEALVKSQYHFFSLILDSSKLDAAMSWCKKNKYEKKLIKTYLEYGASTAMMRTLFGFTSLDVAQMREKMGLQDKGGILP